jgi:hypothetical protein
MGKRILLALMAMAAMTAPAPAFAAWSKGFVVDYFTQPGWKAAEKDTNCPDGDLPMLDLVSVMRTSWRTEEEAKRLVSGAAIGAVRLSDRGPRPGMNVHRDPTLVADPMTPMVVGNTGYGFDLDRNPATGFVSPDGRSRGLDNQHYRALGCLEHYRGGGRNSAEPRPNEEYEMAEMRAGAFTVVIMLSGDGNDPMNDANVRVGFYISKEKLVTDARLAVAPDNSYRIDPDPRFTTVFEARSTGGVITPKAELGTFRMREPGARSGYGQDLILEMAQARLTLKADGNLSAELGGYRNWRYMYMGLAAAGNAGEHTSGYQFPTLWYNWQKAADWKPAGVEGPNTHISVFYTLDAVPAFLITPDTHQVVTRAEVFTGVSQAASRPAQDLARVMQSIGTDTAFRLTGGAASWPRPADPNQPAPPNDQLYWAKAIQDPRGGYYATGLASPFEPPPTPALVAAPAPVTTAGR